MLHINTFVLFCRKRETTMNL